MAFSKAEIHNLRRGVRAFGKRWQVILNAFEFHTSRTAAQLKDKYRLFQVGTVTFAQVSRGVMFGPFARFCVDFSILYRNGEWGSVPTAVKTGALLYTIIGDSYCFHTV